jgi:hypothetical protein
MPAPALLRQGPDAYAQGAQTQMPGTKGNEQARAGTLLACALRNHPHARRRPDRTAEG